MNFRESDEHGRIAGVVIRNVEGLRISLHEKLAFIEINFDDERIAVFPQPTQKLAFDTKRRRAVRHAFFNARQSQCELPHRIEGDRWSFAFAA